MPARFTQFLCWFIFASLLFAALPEKQIYTAQEGKLVEMPAADSPFDGEDDSSDLNLKFWPGEFALAANICNTFIYPTGEVIPAGHILEIPTPPPLLS